MAWKRQPKSSNPLILRRKMTGRPGWTGLPSHHESQYPRDETSVRCEHLKSSSTRPCAEGHKGGPIGPNHQCWPQHQFRAWLSRYECKQQGRRKKNLFLRPMWRANGKSGQRQMGGKT
eukprot:5628369-Amphidinium_carterae.1